MQMIANKMIVLRMTILLSIGCINSNKSIQYAKLVDSTVRGFPFNLPKLKLNFKLLRIYATPPLIPPRGAVGGMHDITPPFIPPYFAGGECYNHPHLHPYNPCSSLPFLDLDVLKLRGFDRYPHVIPLAGTDRRPVQYPHPAVHVPADVEP